MTGIIITAIICGTLIILAGIGAWSNKNSAKNALSKSITDSIAKNLGNLNKH